MTSCIRGLVASAALALCAPFASATVLSFDDIAVTDHYGAVPTSYGGLDWSAAGWSVITTPDAAPFTAHSGDGRIATGWGSTDADTAIRFLTPTVFDGAWFAGYDDVSVQFSLYMGGSLVWSSAALNLSDTSTYLASGWNGLIDTVVVSSNGQAFYVMDDFSFQDAAEVPEPGTLALALAGFGLVLRRARNSKRNA